jgi:hypothetical protein
MTRNTDNNLQTRYEWFMQWKGSDLSYTNNCVFIDEAALKIAKQKKKKKKKKKKKLPFFGIKGFTVLPPSIGQLFFIWLRKKRFHFL